MSKPKAPKLLDQLGMDVEISNKSLGDNKFLSKMLKDMGNTIKPDGHEYVGSYCTHIYKTDIGKEAAFGHHHHFESAPAEALVVTSVQDLSVHLLNVIFGKRKPRTLDPRDKRGDFVL